MQAESEISLEKVEGLLAARMRLVTKAAVVLAAFCASRCDTGRGLAVPVLACAP